MALGQGVEWSEQEREEAEWARAEAEADAANPPCVCSDPEVAQQGYGPGCGH